MGLIAKKVANGQRAILGAAQVSNIEHNFFMSCHVSPLHRRKAIHSFRHRRSRQTPCVALSKWAPDLLYIQTCRGERANIEHDSSIRSSKEAHAHMSAPTTPAVGFSVQPVAKGRPLAEQLLFSREFARVHIFRNAHYMLHTRTTARVYRRRSVLLSRSSSTHVHSLSLFLNPE